MKSARPLRSAMALPSIFPDQLTPVVHADRDGAPGRRVPSEPISG